MAGALGRCHLEVGATSSIPAASTTKCPDWLGFLNPKKARTHTGLTTIAGEAGQMVELRDTAWLLR